MCGRLCLFDIQFIFTPIIDVSDMGWGSNQINIDIAMPA